MEINTPHQNPLIAVILFLTSVGFAVTGSVIEHVDGMLSLIGHFLQIISYSISIIAGYAYFKESGRNKAERLVNFFFKKKNKQD